MTVHSSNNDSQSSIQPESPGRRCPICGSAEYHDFFEIDNIPVSDGLRLRSREEALAAPVGSISLACCHVCGYIRNRLFDSSKLRFDAQYEISLHHSPHYRQFLEETCSYLIAQYNIRNSVVLETGCGKGYFLELICRLGSSRGYGFDPVITEERQVDIGGAKAVYSPDDYSRHIGNIRPSLVCCRHMLHLLADPVRWVKSLRSNLNELPSTVVYLEGPNASAIFRPEGIWCIMYEYHSYFAKSSLTVLFQKAGFEVLRVKPCFDEGQYLQIEATPTGSVEVTDFARPIDLIGQVDSFSTAFRQKVHIWKTRFAEVRTSYKRIVAWGSGGRAICFLNALGIRDQIQYVVDINPDRQGGFMPSTAQAIVGPEFLIDYRPDIIIVTNPTYEQEIREQVANMGLACETISI